MKLYYAPGSCARASHITLREAGADFELALVDFGSAEQRSDAYKRVNPKGRVPALETPDGILTETPAILTYIAQCFPEASLAPIDPFGFAQMQSFNAYLCATVHVAHAHIRRGERWADDPVAIADMQRKAPSVVADCFSLIEQQMPGAGPWVLGDQYSVADPYLFTITQWLPIHRIESTDYPRVHAHLSRMLDRPAVQAAIAAEET